MHDALHSLQIVMARRLTKEPPLLELAMALVIGTILGNTALISAVGASNLGLTSTKYRSSAGKGSCSKSSG